MKSLNDIIWNGDLDLEEGNGNIQFGDNPGLEQSCSVVKPPPTRPTPKAPNAQCIQ